MADIAEQLYNDIKKECPDLPNPSTWILNQTSMRNAWEIYYNHPHQPIMMDNAFSKYMKFMYDSYPPGFGDEMKKAYREHGIINGAILYHKLTQREKVL